MSPPFRIPSRWKHSLYSRALLFTVIGSGCLLGAIVAQSWVMVSGTVERLLQERMSLARATGSYLEEVLHHDFDHIAAALTPLMREKSDKALRDRPEIRQALSTSYFGTVFKEGAFILDADANPIANVPEADPLFLKQDLDLKSLTLQARASSLPIASPLLFLRTGHRPVIILIGSIKSSDSRVLGFLGGFIHPASDNLLKPFEKGSIGTTGTLQLLDATGAVIAATREKSLFTVTDHGSLLSSAIKNKKEIRGRCHACHEDQKNGHAREMEVLAFAPLPTLSLGIAIRQPENEALAPAFVLERRLLVLGLGFIALFLVFTGLSVYSVVSPLKRLTRAVKQLEGTGPEQKLPSFGKDEVGQLASAVELWRSRLESEVRLTQWNLSALQEIAEYSSREIGVEAVLEKGLKILLEFLNFSKGSIELVYHQKIFSIANGLSGPDLKILREALEFRHEDSRKEPGKNAVVLEVFELQQQTVVSARLSLMEDLTISSLLTGTLPPGTNLEQRRIQSILHQIVMSLANLLLHEEASRRHKQSREFLQKMLQTQEEERRRIARELHDTLAQDLAAHRLELERLLGHAESYPADPQFRVKVKQLEEKAHDMLVGLRQMLLDLRPSVLDTMGFLPALHWHLERLKKEHGILGKLSVENEKLRISPETEVALFRIFQEGLQNIVQHAEAKNVLVTVEQNTSELLMSIEDDGKGFEPSSLEAQPIVHRQGHGLGVLGMKERTLLLGGTLTIQSKPGEGATFMIRIPLDKIAENFL